jgi:hypothetical protein
MAITCNWTFTINNYTEVDETTLAGLVPDIASYVVFGREVGDSGTPHLQGYMQLVKKKRLTGMKKLHFTAHWEPAKAGFKANHDYCTKDGDFVEHGKHRGSGAPTMEERIARNKRLRDTPLNELVDSGDISVMDVRKLKNAKLDLAQEKPAFAASDVRGVWIYGPPGSGKSRKAREDFGDDIYLKAQNKWWDGYTGQKTVILDDMDTDALGHHLKIWTDRYACTGEVKGGTVNLQHEVFIVTSNFSIDDLFEKPQIALALKRRFKVEYKGEDDPSGYHPDFTPNTN